MCNRALCTTAIAACLIWAGTAVCRAEAGIHWAKAWVTAKADATHSRKLIMIDFYTDWCGWCKKLDADTYSDAKVIEATQQVVTVKLDAEKEGKAIAQKYKVQGYPTILFIDPAASGKDQADLIGSIVGYLPPAGFLDQFNAVLQDFKDYPTFKKRYAQNPHDVEAIGRLVCIFHGRQDDKRAISLLDEAIAIDPNNAKGSLTKAYNAVGDIHQSKNEIDQAIPYFEKAASTGTKPSDVIYARSSIAACYMSQGKFDQAISQLQAVLSMPDASKEDREQAQQMLEQAQAAKNKK